MKLRKVILASAMSVMCVGSAVAAPAAKAAQAAPGGTAAAEPAADELVDMTQVQDKMSFVTDGKGHYMAYGPIDKSDVLFYGDGKTFYQQRVHGSGSEGTIAFHRRYWDPRSRNASGAGFDFRNKKFAVECGERKIEVTPVPEDEAKAMAAAAKWLKPKWKRKAYLLARDEEARYYYVDRMREPENNNNFRLFVGLKGNLKLQKMTNVVSDTQGDIFSTKTGSLRLIAGQTESSWVQGKKRTKLTQVPVSDNASMIYTDLGVYQHEKLGTPCDDM